MNSAMTTRKSVDSSKLFLKQALGPKVAKLVQSSSQESEAKILTNDAARATLTELVPPLEKLKMAVAVGQSSNLFQRKPRHLGYPHTLPHMGRGSELKSSFVYIHFIKLFSSVLSPTSVGFMARAAADICHGRRARQKPPSSLSLPLTGSPTDGFYGVKGHVLYDGYATG
jgi:hypothetical protein